MSEYMAAGDRPRVRFGSAPNQSVPAEWADLMLSRLARLQPRLFGRLLQEAALDGLPVEREAAR